MTYVTRFTSSVNEIRYCFSVVLLLRIAEIELFKIFLSIFLQLYRFSFDTAEIALNSFASLLMIPVICGLYVYFFIKF
jgi:hypothetical protein